MENIDAAKLRALREKRGMSQRLLAERADLDPKTVYRVESEGKAHPRTLLLIAGALGVEVSELVLTLEGPPALPPDVEEFLRHVMKFGKWSEQWFVAQELQQELGWGVGRINDAVELAKAEGLVWLSEEISGNEFRFRMGHLSALGRLRADPARAGDLDLVLRFLATQGEGQQRGYLRSSVLELAKGLGWKKNGVEDTDRALDSVQLLMDAGFVRDREGTDDVELTPQGRQEAAKLL